MILLMGGAYQGKKQYAQEAYHLEEKDFFYCNDKNNVVDFEKKAVCGLHLLILYQVNNAIDPFVWVKKNLPLLQNKIILCDDISCGVVPIDPHLRVWREMTGRVLLLLAKEADEVYRLFCGIPTRLR